MGRAEWATRGAEMALAESAEIARGDEGGEVGVAVTRSETDVFEKKNKLRPAGRSGSIVHILVDILELHTCGVG